jgi:hypothetical protein
MQAFHMLYTDSTSNHIVEQEDLVLAYLWGSDTKLLLSSLLEHEIRAQAWVGSQMANGKCILLSNSFITLFIHIQSPDIQNNHDIQEKTN